MKAKIKKVSQFQKGHKGYRAERNGFWKGDKAGYHAIHQWIRANFGTADRCENKLCVYPRRNRAGLTLKVAESFEWALIHGKSYVHQRENFIRLCNSCHKKYDTKKETIEV